MKGRGESVPGLRSFDGAEPIVVESSAIRGMFDRR